MVIFHFICITWQIVVLFIIIKLNLKRWKCFFFSKTRTWAKRRFTLYTRIFSNLEDMTCYFRTKKRNKRNTQVGDVIVETASRGETLSHITKHTLLSSKNNTIIKLVLVTVNVVVIFLLKYYIRGLFIVFKTKQRLWDQS